MEKKTRRPREVNLSRIAQLESVWKDRVCVQGHVARWGKQKGTLVMVKQNRKR